MTWLTAPVLDHFHQILHFFHSSHLLHDLLLLEGGAWEVTLVLWPCLWSSNQDGPGPPGCVGAGSDRHSIHDLNAAHSLNFPTTSSTEVPKSSDGETGASWRKLFSFSPMSAKFTHRCLSIATITITIDLPTTAAVCLVNWRAKSHDSEHTSHVWPVSEISDMGRHTA